MAEQAGKGKLSWYFFLFCNTHKLGLQIRIELPLFDLSGV